jgi:tetratricopeptide (TPR) repeat protein
MRRFLLVLCCFGASFAFGQTDDAVPAPSPSGTPEATPSPTPDAAAYVPEIAKTAAAEGNAAFIQKDYDRARKAYRKVLDLVPDNPLALINLGMVEFAAGNSAEAEKFLKRAVQVKLNAPPAWLTLGMMYMDQNRLDDALAALSQAVLYDSRNARAHNYLGVVIGRKGWIDGAQDELRKAVEIDDNYSDAHYNLAAFYLENKPPSYELARRHYYRAVELGADRDPDMEKTLKALETAPKP